MVSPFAVSLWEAKQPFRCRPSPLADCGSGWRQPRSVRRHPTDREDSGWRLAAYGGRTRDGRQAGMRHLWRAR
jgi:hypothetical protein